jgi:hypothetical protein
MREEGRSGNKGEEGRSGNKGRKGVQGTKRRKDVQGTRGRSDVREQEKTVTGSVINMGNRKTKIVRHGKS